VVEDLLASRLRVDLVVAASSVGDTARGAVLLEAAAERSLPIRLLPDDAFQKLALTEQAQGVLAVAGIPPADWSALDPAGSDAVVRLLDAVRDPGSLGTLARTAEALGAAALITLQGTVDPWNPKAVRAAAGSLFRLPVLGSDWEQASEELLRRGYLLLAAEAGG